MALPRDADATGSVSSALVDIAERLKPLPKAAELGLGAFRPLGLLGEGAKIGPGLRIEPAQLAVLPADVQAQESL